MNRDDYIIRRLDEIGRTRALTMRESVTLELAIRRVENRERMRRRYREDPDVRAVQIARAKARYREGREVQA